MLHGRQKDIFDLLYEKKRVSVRELAQKLYVSEMTIRRDLAELEQKGMVRRYRGGAVFCMSGEETPISRRFFLQEAEKKCLAKKAEKYLHDDMTVYIDSSSTAQYVIPFFEKYKNITMITNSVKALLIASEIQIPCILIGGEYFAWDMCAVGSAAERNAREYNVDLAIFSARGLSENGVISDPDQAQTMIRKVVMENAKKSVFLFEKEKQGKKYLYTLCRVEDAEEIILSEDGNISRMSAM